MCGELKADFTGKYSNGKTVGKMGKIRRDPKKNGRVERSGHRFPEYNVLPHSRKLENSL